MATKEYGANIIEKLESIRNSENSHIIDEAIYVIQSLQSQHSAPQAKRKEAWDEWEDVIS